MDDLENDHRRARKFRVALEAAGVKFPLPSPTNIVYMEVPDPAGLAKRLLENGILVNPPRTPWLRVVFHRDISDQDLDQAIEIFKRNL